MGNDIARQFAHLPAAEAAEAGSPRHIETVLGPADARQPARARPGGRCRPRPLVVAAATRVTAS